jgi:hypothetical protein
VAYAFAFLLFLLAVLFVRRLPLPIRPAAGKVSLSFAELRALALKCALVMVITLSIAVLVIQMSFLYAERGVTDSGILGLLIGSSATGIAVGAATAGLLARFQPRVVLGLGFGLIALGFVLVSLPLSATSTAIAALPVGLGCGLASPAILAATFSYAHESKMGLVSGIYTAAIFVGQFASTPVIVGLKSAAGSLAGSILLLGCLTAAVSVLVLLTGFGTQRKPGTSPASH